MTKHTELIARLEAAEVGSRELDAEVWDIEDDRPRWSFGDDFPIYKRDPDDSVAFDSPPPYTTSLDAALALAERVGLKPALALMTVMAGANCGAGSTVADLARYACIAILKALDAKHD